MARIKNEVREAVIAKTTPIQKTTKVEKVVKKTLKDSSLQ